MSISVGDTVDDFAAIRFIFAWSVILHEQFLSPKSILYESIYIVNHAIK